MITNFFAPSVLFYLKKCNKNLPIKIFIAYWCCTNIIFFESETRERKKNQTANWAIFTYLSLKVRLVIFLDGMRNVLTIFFAVLSPHTQFMTRYNKCMKEVGTFFLIWYLAKICADFFSNSCFRSSCDVITIVNISVTWSYFSRIHKVLKYLKLLQLRWESFKKSWKLIFRNYFFLKQNEFVSKNKFCGLLYNVRWDSVLVGLKSKQNLKQKKCFW